MITVQGDKELRRELKKVEERALKKTLQRGTNAAAKYMKPKAQSAAPSRTGTLRKSIRAGQAKRGRPASIVKAGKKGWYEHFVIRGTKPHRIRFPDQKAAGVPKTQGNIEHPGAKANDFMGQTIERYQDEAYAVAVRTIREELP